MEDVNTGVLAKIKNILEVKLKPKNDMMYQDIYNCICQNAKKWRYTIYYVKSTAQLLFKNRNVLYLSMSDLFIIALGVIYPKYTHLLPNRLAVNRYVPVVHLIELEHQQWIQLSVILQLFENFVGGWRFRIRFQWRDIIKSVFFILCQF